MDMKIEINKSKARGVIQQVFANYGIIDHIPFLIVENFSEAQVTHFLNCRPKTPIDCIMYHLDFNTTKQGRRFWDGYSEGLQSYCDPAIFHDCKPPYRGWWYTHDRLGKAGPWRWWDGDRWSVGYHSHESLEQRSVWMLGYETPKNYCPWSFYYPNDARLPRINQDWRGFKEITQRWVAAQEISTSKKGKQNG